MCYYFCMAKETIKRKVGRPTKYHDGICKMVDEYLVECEDKFFDWQRSFGKTDSFERIIDVNLPTYEGLSEYLDVCVDTLLEWRTIYPEFSASLAKVLRKQKAVLLKRGLSGEYNPTIAKLILSSNHGMAEKTELDHTSGGERITGFNYVKPDEANN